MAELVLTPEKREEFLDALREIPNVVRACRKVGISRVRMYELYKTEPDFAKRWDDAIAEGVESMEAEAQRRAFEGYPIVTKHGTFEGFSDTLAIFLLKAHAPEKYRETSKLELTGKDGGPVKIEDESAAAAQIASLLATAQQRKDNSDIA